MSIESREQFVADAKTQGFEVEFSGEVARVILYSDERGQIRFTSDVGGKGDHSITLELPVAPTDSEEVPRFRLAVERTRGYLEACGFDVEIWS